MEVQQGKGMDGVENDRMGKRMVDLTEEKEENEKNANWSAT